ncbi:MAG: hypothetical protein FWD15_01250 [Alphaproteobacteria bacterium]|nr:hypothetical protein [Alphaproteobacteria bacterium]
MTARKYYLCLIGIAVIAAALCYSIIIVGVADTFMAAAGLVINLTPIVVLFKLALDAGKRNIPIFAIEAAAYIAIGYGILRLLGVIMGGILTAYGAPLDSWMLSFLISMSIIIPLYSWAFLKYRKIAWKKAKAFFKKGK